MSRSIGRPLLVALAACALLATPAHASPPIALWDTPQSGTNFFNAVEKRERFEAAAAAGIHLVRLAPDKWKGAGRDFLLGNADDYRGIPPADLATLRGVLDDAQRSGVRVVLTMLSLPGCRWKQNNGDLNDFRLYLEPRFRTQATQFWKDLATALRGHPALAGYDLLNEPRPERDRGTAAFDVGELYAPMVEAIRSVDSEIPIVLEGSDDASPAALSRLKPLADSKVLYSFHFYEPWEFIDHRSNDPKAWPAHDRAALAKLLAPVEAWQKAHGVSSSRVWLSEFGIPRTKPGAATWLGDVAALANAHGWHWSFYSFREDTWDAMDYELGDRPPGAEYWEAKERGLNPELPRRPNALWKALTEARVAQAASAKRPNAPPGNLPRP